MDLLQVSLWVVGNEKIKTPTELVMKIFMGV
jgi:hypothetical protein